MQNHREEALFPYIVDSNIYKQTKTYYVLNINETRKTYIPPLLLHSNRVLLFFSSLFTSRVDYIANKNKIIIILRYFFFSLPITLIITIIIIIIILMHIYAWPKNSFSYSVSRKTYIEFILNIFK